MTKKVSLAVAGVALLVLVFVAAVFFGFTGWMKWALVMVGALMVMPLWHTFAGTPAPQEKRPTFRGFDETNIGDSMQDGWGFNGHSNDK